MIPGSANPLLLASTAAAPAVYAISRSLRFNSADSAYLSRTPASAGNRKTWTWAGWVKRSKLETNQCLFVASDFATTTTLGRFLPGNTIEFYDYQSGAHQMRLITSPLYRDPSAWYHIVFTWDSDNTTSNDRARIYVNGSRVTAFSTAIYPPSGTQSRWNNNVAHEIGKESTANYFDGLLADIHFIDGQALDPTSFGEFDTNGIWQPIEYTGTYGTNGFHLPFSDNSTAAALGTDTSGNGNDWTVNNISVSSIATGLITSANWYLYKLEFTAAADGYVNQFVVKNNSINVPFNSVNLINILKNGSELTQSITAGGGGGSDSTTTYWTGPFNSRINQSPRQQNGEVGNPWGTGYGGNPSAYPELLNYSSSYTLGSPLTNAAPGSGPYTATFTGFSYSAGDTISFYITSYGTSAGNNGYFIVKGGPTTSSTNILVETNPFGSSILINRPSNIDSLVDSPTNGTQTDTGLGGEVRGNYATANPLDQTTGNGITLSNGNLDVVLANANVRGTIAIPSSGKWYFEWTITKFYTDSNGSFGVSGGVVKPGNTAFCGVTPTTNNPYDAGGIYKNGTKVETVTGLSLNDVFAIAIDMDALTLQAYRNGATYGASITLDSAVYLPRFQGNGNNTGDANTASINFGQRPFAYTAPSGFKALCTANLPTPTILKGSDYFDTKLYTGNGSTQTISGLAFSPDFVWIKNRVDSAAGEHRLFDQVRGATKALYSNLTNTEATETLSLTAFTSDGFTVSSGNYVNGSSDGMAAWCWDAGSSTVTNTQGSITSTVRANPSAGFSIVTYTGTGANATVGHGLGVAPAFMVLKVRNNGTYQWPVYHSALTNPQTAYIYLNRTDAVATYTGFWNSTNPSGTVFSLGTDAQVNGNSNTYVAYCFAPVAGYSSFGSYTGNGSADGPFVYTGFRPRWILIKNASATANWVIQDTARSIKNIATEYLLADLSAAEGNSDIMDITSNGFKQRNTFASNNASGNTYVWAAFAENPFSIARAR